MGPARGAALARRGLATVGDLLALLPTRYEELPPPAPPAAAAHGRLATVTGTVEQARVGRLRRRGARYLDLRVKADGAAAEDAAVRVLFYNQAWLADRLPRGTRIAVTGVARREGARLALVARRHEVLAAESPPAGPRIVPVLPRIPGVPAGILRRLVGAARAALAASPDPLPAAARARFALPELARALELAHEPSAADDAARGRRRLLFDRFLALFLPLFDEEEGEEPAPAIVLDAATRARLARLLPFALTGGQRAALDALAADLRGPRPMRRLLQGEVGAGKTAVALLAAAAAALSGWQTLLLAPTEPLVLQHALGARALLGAAGTRVATLSAALGAEERRALAADLERGAVDLLIATHAALEEDVALPRLGLVIIDEQHRFGVRQRLRARRKGAAPHVLALSATPIPRTLCLALLGDLDHTVIAERPPGRSPVAAVVGRRDEAFAAVRRAAAAGERAFVVFPSIEGGEMPALLDHGRRLVAGGGPLAGIPHAFLHGRMDAEERERALAGFRAGTTPLLLSTVIIEVGIDVPEATVMIVAGAERFGLATLHQLRGRVGRGERPGCCYLLPSRAPRGPSPEALARLEVLAREQDGFRIAEEDLRLRGPGELVGVRQAGMGTLPEARGEELLLFEAAREFARAEGRTIEDRRYFEALAGGLADLPGRPRDAV